MNKQKKERKKERKIDGRKKERNSAPGLNRVLSSNFCWLGIIT